MKARFTIDVLDSAKSLGSVYLGDNKLTIETFTYTRHEEDIQGQGTLSVTKGDCIPNSNDFAGRVGESKHYIYLPRQHHP